MQVSLSGEFPTKAQPILRTAHISDCGRYRFKLTRIWRTDKPLLVTCMLNPSTADAERDDPTIRTLIHFGKAWGYGGLMVVNLFALRTPSPKELLATAFDDRKGMKSVNATHVSEALTYARHTSGRALAAWGNVHPHLINDTNGVLHLAHQHYVNLVCLGITANGFPKHPMARGTHRIAADQQPISFRPARVKV
jgi:hypothetical protein